ncbi:MAG TPA: hypothetical protein VIK33_11870, partial [Anaerolineae bacterium]
IATRQSPDQVGASLNHYASANARQGIGNWRGVVVGHLTSISLEMVRELMKVEVEPGDIAARRDKAAAAFLFLSGARATAFCTLTLECVDIAERTVKQYPTMGVKTKNGKAGLTRLLEIPDLLQVVEDWDSFVRTQLPPTAPWYPIIDMAFGVQA